MVIFLLIVITVLFIIATVVLSDIRYEIKKSNKLLEDELKLLNYHTFEGLKRIVHHIDRLDNINQNKQNSSGENLENRENN